MRIVHSGIPIVRIEFWDHCSGSESEIQAMKCELVGWLTSEDDLSFLVTVWRVLSDDIPDQNDAYRILKSTVTRLDFL